MGRASRFLLAAVLACLVVASAGAGDRYAQTSDDGLERVSHRRLDAFYLRPGTGFGEFQRVHVGACSVSFREHWLREQNRYRPLSTRVGEKEMERIRTRLAESCRKSFVDELVKAGYQVVDADDAGVLSLRPAIVDLDLFAPEVDVASRVRTWSASAAEMTLQLDFDRDGTVVARAIDYQRDRDSLVEQRTRISNEFDTATLLRRWARIVRETLDG